MSTILSMTRDEIMPMVWTAQTSTVHLNVIIDERNDMLIVAGRNDKRNVELGFAITHNAIAAGLYRWQLRPALQRLVFALECEAIEEYEQELVGRPPSIH